MSLGAFHFPSVFQISDPDLLHPLICCFLSLVYFLFQFLCSSTLILFYNFSLLKFLLSSSTRLSSPVNIFMTMTLNSFSGGSLTFISFSSFYKFCLILSFGIYSFVSSFCLTFCACFCVLGRAATSPSPKGMSSLCRTVPSVVCICLVSSAGAVAGTCWGSQGTSWESGAEGDRGQGVPRYSIKQRVPGRTAGEGGAG